MRKFLIPIAAAASVFAVATPAAAQWYPPQPQGYGYDYGYGYGQNVNPTVKLRYQIQRIRNDIVNYDRRGYLSPSDARRLDARARALNTRIERAAWNGMSYNEQRYLSSEFAQLQRAFHREARVNRRWSSNRYDRRYDDRRRDRYDD